MSEDVALDVAIGLTLMYLMLSLLCTVINEFIATALDLRAKTLAKSVGTLLDDNALKCSFYAHGLIKSSRDAKDGEHPSYLASRDFAMAIIGSLDPTKPLPVFADIETAVKALPLTSNISNVLLAQVMLADGKLDKLRDNISVWFDSSMDRVSGIYKRQVKIISLLVGLAVAAAFGADSVHVARSLWQDPAMRAAAVQSAQSYTNNHPSSTIISGDAKIAANAVSDALSDAQSQLRPLPLGWDMPPGGVNLSWCWTKIVGLLVTALALSLGAPFWFDLLGKFISIRGTGVKPERLDPTS